MSPEPTAADADIAATFVRSDVGPEALEGEGFDLAFARLVLSHLVDPMAVVRAMTSAVVVGGVVAVEDLFTPSLRAEPHLPALDDLIDVYDATVRCHGGDPTIGPRLAAHLSAAGLVDVGEQTVSNRMSTVEQKMFLAELLDNMRDAILSAGAATADRLRDIRAAVAEGAQRPDTVFVQARMHQVAGRRA